MSLKTTVVVRLFDEEFEFDVDFRIIEIVERVFDSNVDLCAHVYLATNPKLTQVAEIVYQWLRLKSNQHSRDAVKGEIYGMAREDLQKVVGAIQGACAFMRKQVGEDELKKLADGKDLDDQGVDAEEKKST